MDLVIRNGTVITSAGTFAADIGIVGERIAALGQGLRGKAEIEAIGCYVLPGAVDPHVHFQMPVGGYVSTDDFASGSVAAACGGTTTVIDFVEPLPGQSFLQALSARRTQADGRVAVDYGLHMTIPAWHADCAEALNSLPQVVAAGVPSFKLYLAYTGLRLDDAQLYRVLRAVAEVGGLPIVHCENGPVCEVLRAEALEQGQMDPIYHARTRPTRQEAEAVGRALDIAALAHSPLYIVHISCADALARLATARGQGQRAYGETCPQYLALTAESLAGPYSERFVCSPPLRSAADQSALWAALAQGTLDVLATDHCPFTSREKAGHADFTSIPGGLPSVEARLGLSFTLGVRTGLVSLERWVEVCCTAPARLFGLRGKGCLAPGFDADVVVFDPQAQVTLSTGALHEQTDWTPYEGLRLLGWPRHVLSRGRLVVQEGQFVGQPGWGRFVARSHAAPPPLRD